MSQKNIMIHIHSMLLSNDITTVFIFLMVIKAKKTYLMFNFTLLLPVAGKLVINKATELPSTG